MLGPGDDEGPAQADAPPWPELSESEKCAFATKAGLKSRFDHATDNTSSILDIYAGPEALSRPAPSKTQN